MISREEALAFFMKDLQNPTKYEICSKCPSFKILTEKTVRCKKSHCIATRKKGEDFSSPLFTLLPNDCDFLLEYTVT